MASANFLNLTTLFAKGDIDFDVNTFKTMLVSSVPSEANLDSWTTRANVTNEVVGTGYTTGGINQPFTLDAVDTVNNRQPVTWTNLTDGWTGATFTAAGAIIYKNVGSAATDLLFAFLDFGGNVTCTAGSFSVDYLTDFFINR